MNKKVRVCNDITGLPGFQSCHSPGHDAFGCTLNKQLVKRSRSRPNGIKSSPAQQQTVGAVNFDPATIAMLRTAIMGQQPTTTPTATSPSPSANPAPTSTGNAGQFQQDIMRIFSHILPGNTEAQAVFDKYTAATVTVQLGNDSTTAILFDCNNPFALDTCAEVSFCHVSYYERRLAAHEATKLLAPVRGRELRHVGHSNKSLGYCGNCFVNVNMKGRLKPVYLHVCMDIDPAILPTFGKDMLTFYGVTLFMRREECMFQPDGCVQVYRFLCALLRDPNFTMPKPTSTAVTTILNDMRENKKLASLWPPTPPATAHGHLLNDNTTSICDQSNSEPVTSVRGRNVAAQAVAPPAPLEATEFETLNLAAQATAPSASLDATEFNTLTPRLPVHSPSSDTAVLAKDDTEVVAPEPNVPQTYDQHVPKITITMENIDDEIYRALNTIIMHGHDKSQEAHAPDYHVETAMIVPSPTSPALPSKSTMGSNKSPTVSPTSPALPSKSTMESNKSPTISPASTTLDWASRTHDLNDLVEQSRLFKNLPSFGNRQ